MSRYHPYRFGWVLVLVFGLWAVAGQAQEFRYRYVSLDGIKLPAPFTVFFPTAIQNSGRVYGTVCDDLCSEPHIAFYKDGAVTVLGAIGFSGPVNADGTVGGSVLVDPVNFIVQAALFRGDKVELIQPGELFSFVSSLNDPGTALVESFDASGNQTSVLYSKDKATPLNFGPTVTSPRFFSSSSVNNQGIIAGTNFLGFNGDRGFRFDPRTGKTMLLNPFPGDPTETLAWGLGINTRGDVLGYSFTIGVTPYHERIGVWDRKGDFKTYFVATISSNRLLFNDNNLIVITLIFSTHTSYLVPKPDVRLNLADLVGNLPEGQDLFNITGVNNHGDMIGFSSTGNNFLLQRSGATVAKSFAPPATTAVKVKQHAMPPVAAAILRRNMPQLNELK